MNSEPNQQGEQALKPKTDNPGPGRTDGDNAPAALCHCEVGADNRFWNVSNRHEYSIDGVFCYQPLNMAPGEHL